MRKALIIILILVVGGFGVYWFQTRGKDQAGHDHMKETYYCPMHPQIQRDQPGNCPVCSMKLVKKDAGTQEHRDTEHDAAAHEAPRTLSGHAPVHLDTRQQELIGLRTAAAGIQTIGRNIRTVGVVAHDPELYQLQTEYLSAFRGFRRFQERGASAEMLESARRLMESAFVHLKHSGFSGDLIREMEISGEADHTLFFNHGGDVWIYAPVYEYELPFVKTGDSVDVEVPALNGRVFPGTVKAFDVMVDPRTRTVRCRIRVNDPEAELKPSMNVNVTFASHPRDVLAVPSSAVMDTGNRRIVFVEETEGRFVPRDISTGQVVDQWTEVVDGLKQGDRVVVDGNFLLDSESRLRSTLENVSGDAADPRAGHSH